MARIEKWASIPPGIRAHLIERMHERGVKVEDLNRLRLWIESSPRCLPAPGTKTSVVLSFAVKESIQKRCYHAGRSRVEKSCKGELPHLFRGFLSRHFRFDQLPRFRC